MRAHLLISILVLSACARQPETTLPTAWARTDGQPVVPELLDIAGLDCKDQLQTPDGAAHSKLDKDGDGRAVVDAFVTCMREHGYVQIKS